MRGEGFEYVDNNSSIHVDWHLKSSNFIKEAQKQKPFDANRVADIDNDHDELVDKNVQHNHSCVEVEMLTSKTPPVVHMTMECGVAAAITSLVSLAKVELQKSLERRLSGCS
ncbi:hypothetical protein SUGI_0616080 [Cryptomeria japonica]|uniref:uncharacterized protein LOC131043732 isoform X2 n=1 Tax=Cryptomeria japonica TaxID=3369 RepID=UPI002414CF49|nr:uncharacterized protein LOC131043732 isoform X2 [Cryptomeria japonica]GLJ30927.1 hypothetical protein SUGI_0616080 [Cryptomeria japonica]